MIKLLPGAPCNQFQGYCDMLEKCRGVDSEGPLERIKNILFGGEAIENFVGWVKTYWWATILIGIGLILLMAGKYSFYVQICVFVCMHACMFVCMYSMYIRMYVHMYVCMHTCMYVHMLSVYSTYVRDMNLCLYTHMYVCMFLRAYVK